MRKRTPLDIFKLPITILRNKDEKFTFIMVNEDGALARSSKSMQYFHNMKTIDQKIGGYASSLN